MPGDLPEYYFRVRENGAFVFRIDPNSRNLRVEMEQIAVLNLKKGEVKPHSNRALTGSDVAAIEAWMDDRRTLLARRDIDDIHRTIDHLNLTTHWAHSKANDEDLEKITERLLMAMHDLRSVLVRRKADRQGDQD